MFTILKLLIVLSGKREIYRLIHFQLQLTPNVTLEVHFSGYSTCFDHMIVAIGRFTTGAQYFRSSPP